LRVALLFDTDSMPDRKSAEGISDGLMTEQESADLHDRYGDEKYREA
jgi:hypothetical protein